MGATIQSKSDSSSSTRQPIEAALSLNETRSSQDVNNKKTKSKEKKMPSSVPTKPKRPLSAYNLFFRHERNRILAKTGCRLGIPANSEDMSHLLKVRRTKSGKRPHRKSHGLIGFKDLARAVAAQWKSADDETRTRYDKLAAVEKLRYQKDMKAYRSRLQGEKDTGAVNTTKEQKEGLMTTTDEEKSPQGNSGNKLVTPIPQQRALANFDIVPPPAPSTQAAMPSIMPVLILIPPAIGGGAPRLFFHPMSLGESSHTDMTTALPSTSHSFLAADSTPSALSYLAQNWNLSSHPTDTPGSYSTAYLPEASSLNAAEATLRSAGTVTSLDETHLTTSSVPMCSSALASRNGPSDLPAPQLHTMYGNDGLDDLIDDNIEPLPFYDTNLFCEFDLAR